MSDLGDRIIYLIEPFLAYFWVSILELNLSYFKNTLHSLMPFRKVCQTEQHLVLILIRYSKSIYFALFAKDNFLKINRQENAHTDILYIVHVYSSSAVREDKLPRKCPRRQKREN